MKLSNLQTVVGLVDQAKKLQAIRAAAKDGTLSKLELTPKNQPGTTGGFNITDIIGEPKLREMVISACTAIIEETNEKLRNYGVDTDV